MPGEVVEYFSSVSCGRIADCTVGYGGHSSLILEKYDKAEIIGLDRDIQAVEYAEERLRFAGERVRIFHSEFSSLKECVEEAGWSGLDGVLMDLGVSSPQIDSAERGFSFKYDGPLDMRMNRQSPMTAARVLNRFRQDDLADIFYKYGEIRESRRLAKAIVERRKEKPWKTTGEFAELCGKVLRSGRKKSIPPATLCFQALRIYVNRELEELENTLKDAVELLNKGGRIAVISFHSLEDRIVKHFFREAAKDCICPPGLPECVCSHKKSLKILTRKPVTAGREEVQKNPRAACAKLRVAEKL
jgi:16S rRNA (cytosine1402-N4)-methyltransferase